MPNLLALKADFTRYSWPLLTTLVLGLLLCKARKTLSQLATGHSISSLSRFLNEYTWSVEHIRQYRQEQLAAAVCQRHQGRRGRKPTFYLIIDDTVIPKWGRHIAKLGRHFCSTQKKVVWGHCLVFSYLVAGEIEGPWDWKLYVNERFCSPESFQTKIQLANAMIEAFEPPFPGKVMVLMDSAYLCKAVIQTARRKGYEVVGTVKKNRPIEFGSQVKHLKTGEVNFLTQLNVPMRFAWVRRKRGRKCVGCTDLRLKAQMIRRHYKCRWAVETFFQTAKHQFGMGHYQIRRWKGIERWIELVLLVYTLSALKRKGQMRWDEAKSHALQSLVPIISQIRQELIATVWVLLCYLQGLVSISDPKGAQKGVVM